MLRSAVDGLGGDVGLSILHVNSRRNFGVNAQAQLPAASVIKLAILTELLFRVERGDFKFSDDIPIANGSSMVASPEASSGVLCLIDSSISLTLSELAALMMIVSDNIAADLLIQRLGMDHVNSRMKLLGLTGTTLNTHFRDAEVLWHEGCNTTTAEDMVTLLSHIFDGTVPFHDFASSLLRQQRFRHGIPYYLPNETIVLNKTGTIFAKSGTVTVNDVGIIVTEDPIIISFLSTRQKSFAVASITIASIAKALFAEMRSFC